MQARFARWLDTPGISPRLRAWLNITAADPAFTQHDSAFYEDDNSNVNSNSVISSGASSITRDTGTANRVVLRIALDETANRNWDTENFQLWVSYNSGSYTQVSGSNSYVRPTAGQFNDGDATTQRLQNGAAGSYSNGTADDNDAICADAGSKDDYTEYAYCVYVFPDNVSGGNTLDFEVRSASGYSITYTERPRITVAGQNLVRVRDEAVNINETRLSSRTMARIRSETLGINEVELFARDMIRLRDEIMWIVEDRLPIIGLVRMRDEAISIIETRLSALGLGRLINETINVNETTFRSRTLARLIAETLQFNELTPRSRTMARVYSEALDVNEVILNVRSLVRLRSESIDVVETRLPVRGIVKLINETIDVIESTGRITRRVATVIEQIVAIVGT